MMCFFKKTALCLLLGWGLILPAFSQVCDCLTTGNCPVIIEDNGTFQGTLDVTVNGPNNLALCPLTSVCFSITHTWVGDLDMLLVSPTNTKFIVMSDAFDRQTSAIADLTLSDSASSSMPQIVSFSGGTFKPTDVIELKFPRISLNRHAL